MKHVINSYNNIYDSNIIVNVFEVGNLPTSYGNHYLV